MRGLFEYVYSATMLRILPHIPAGITEYAQKFPVRWGPYSLMISTKGDCPSSQLGPSGTILGAKEMFTVVGPCGQYFLGSAITFLGARIPSAGDCDAGISSATINGAPLAAAHTGLGPPGAVRRPLASSPQ